MVGWHRLGLSGAQRIKRAQFLNPIFWFRKQKAPHSRYGQQIGKQLQNTLERGVVPQHPRKDQ